MIWQRRRFTAADGKDHVSQGNALAVKVAKSNLTGLYNHWEMPCLAPPTPEMLRILTDLQWYATEQEQ